MDGDTRAQGGVSRRRTLLAALALLALTFAAHGPALSNGWIWDDDDYVWRNPLLAAPGGLGRIWLGLERESRDPLVLSYPLPQYYPLVFTSFWAEHALWGLAPAGFHATN